MTNTDVEKHFDSILTDIAAKWLRVKTLETRDADCLDFYEVSVWRLRAALVAAYEAGRERALKINGASDSDEVVG